MMHGNLAPGYELWLEPVLVLAVGAVVIAGLAALAGRLATAAVWQRTVWQAATLGLLVLVALELTGTASALVRLARRTMESPSVEMEPPERGRPENNSGTVPIFPQGKWDCPPSGAQAVARAEEQDSTQAVEVAADDWARAVHRVEFPVAATASITADWTAPAPPSFAWSEAAHLGAGVATEGALRGGRRIARGLSRFSRRENGTVPLPNREVIDRPPFSETDLAVAEIEVEGSLPPTTVEVSQRASPFPVTGVSPGEQSPVAAVREPRSGNGWWPGMVWGLGAAVLAVRLLWTRLLLVLFRRRHPAVSDEALCRRVAALARRLGVRRLVTVLEAARLSAPVAFGSVRPTLALPAAFSDDFDRRQQEAMIAHELAHLAARDPAWQLVADATCAALWWHPACWWSRRRLRAASEAAADEASLVIPEGPEVLACCLVALGRRLAEGRRTRRLGWVSIEGPGFRSGLGRRVERLLSLSSRRRPPRRGFLMFGTTTLLVALVIVAVFSTTWVRSQATIPEGGPVMNVLAISWRHSVAAAALAAFLAPLAEEAVPQEHGHAPIVIRDEGPGDNPFAHRGEHQEREVLARRLEALRTALPALREGERGDAVELLERAIHAGEVTLEGRRDDEANEIRERAPGPGELAEILTMAAELWRKFENPDKAEFVGRLADELRAEREHGHDAHHHPQERERREAEERERHMAEDRERQEAEERERHEAEEQGREREEHVHNLKREFEELAGESHRIQGELEGLRDGQDEEAHELHGALDEIHARMHDVEREVAELTGDRPHPEIAERERGEVEGRIEHVRAAIENLHAAGLHEQAEHLEREMEHFAHGGPRPDDRAPRDAPPPRDYDGRPHPEQLDPAIIELGNQLRTLNERIEEMGREVEQAVNEVRDQVENRNREFEQAINEVRHEMEGMGSKIEERSQEFEAWTKEIEEREEDFRREVEASHQRQRDDDEDDDRDDDDDDDR